MRPNVAEDQEDVRALSREQLETLLAIVPDSWRLFVTVLAATGLRVSEAIALRWGDLQLDGSHPAPQGAPSVCTGPRGAS